MNQSGTSSQSNYRRQRFGVAVLNLETFMKVRGLVSAPIVNCGINYKWPNRIFNFHYSILDNKTKKTNLIYFFCIYALTEEID